MGLADMQAKEVTPHCTTSRIGTSFGLAADGLLRQIHTHTLNLTSQSQCGFLFDVTAKSYDIAVSAISFIPGSQDGEYDIWLATEQHERVHQNAKAWTLVAQASHHGPVGQRLTIQLGCHAKIPRDSRYAFYISGRNVNAVCFGTESRYANSAENEDVIIHLGHFKAFPWEGVLSTGPFGHNGMQEFIGVLEYQVLQSPAADHCISTHIRLWETRAFTDGELIASDGRKFSVHRGVLAAASPHLEEAFRTLAQIQDDGKGVHCLKVDAPGDTVEALLHFMYTGDEGHTADPGEMLKLAHLYSLHALVRSCAARLANNLSTSNVIESVRALRPYRDHPACLGAWQMLISNVQVLLSGNPQILQEVLLSV
jgi:hypothetical protein|mmetsp:Transcript_71229/g.111459  ORF Transcript_71229/g.111459 Transcript_71229/m.111459 type:complete len:368 (-) Transcript_71229:89-1192(-)